MSRRPTPQRLQPSDLAASLAAGAMLVDVRDPRAFGAGHVAGSLNVWIDGPQFAERVSWFAPPSRPLVLLAETEGEVARALSSLVQIGLDAVEAYVVGTAAIAASDLPSAVLPNVTAPELARRLQAGGDLVVLDVREPLEWEEGHIAGAVHIPMREVAGRAGELPRDRPIALVCRGGPRSSLVGSMLLGRGFTRLTN